MKNPSFAALAFLLSIGSISYAQSLEQGYDSDLERFAPRARHQTQLVKYYKPTQTYYGKGYVVRYGYATTNPFAAGYSTANVVSNRPLSEFLTVANPEERRQITLTQASVKLSARDDSQSKREVQPAQAKAPQPESKVETKGEPKVEPKPEARPETKGADQKQ